MNKVGDTLIHTGENEELVRAFVNDGIEFILVGGLAVAWYCAERQADDMDLLVNPTRENSQRIHRVLTNLGLSCHRRDSFTRPGLQVPLKSRHYADLLTPKPTGPTFPEVEKDAINAKLFNTPIRLASQAMLIRMKDQAIASEEASIEKHRQDIECLQKHA